MATKRNIPPAQSPKNVQPTAANSGKRTADTKAPAKPKKPLITAPLENLSEKFAPVGAWINKFSVQAIMVALVAFALNINTVGNEYAHDDGITIVKNEYVLEGIAGIPSLLTKDAYDSYYKQLNTGNQLSGGRYRPLSVISFAIEQQFFGAVPVDKVDSVLKQATTYGVRGPQEKKLVHDMHIRHFFNVIWYMLCVVVLLYMLRYIVLRDEPLIALLATLIFTAHPIHTEVIANVKSRDEIMSLLFICLTFITAFKYDEHKKPWMLALSCFSYFLAFLAKEYAITLLALIPLAFYLFNNKTIRESIIKVIPFVITAGLYIALRRHYVGTQQGEGSDNEVLNNPYLFATPAEKLATEIATSLNYIKLLIIPTPLSADYSYNSIPYKDFSHPLVWLSLLVHGGLIAAGVYYFKRRSFLCFAIAFYFIHLLLICNIIFDIGATMGERLIFHSSVGFALAAAYFICKGLAAMADVKTRRMALTGIMSVILVLFSIKTISRNLDWKNDKTLFFQDLNTVPNSVLVNGNVAASYISMSDYEKNDSIKRKYLFNAIDLLNNALSVHRTFVAGFLNRGIAYFKLGDLDKAKPNFDTVRTLYPNYPTLESLYKLLGQNYNSTGWNVYGKAGKFDLAAVEFEKALACDSLNPEIWYNLGGSMFNLHQYPQAQYAWMRALRINPNYKEALQAYQIVTNALNNPANRQPQPGQPQQQNGQQPAQQPKR